MEHIEFDLEASVPVFLGGADQTSEWRTPPVKALLRQWWRIVRAAACDYDHVRLRRDEALLFGHAWLESSTPRRSRVQISFPHGWAAGSMTDIGPEKLVRHPEVELAKNGIGANLYLGYGPLTFKQGTKLKFPPAVRPGCTIRLRVAFPRDVRSEVVAALRCLHWFGSLGGRSRNGWGSFSLRGDGVDRLPELGTAEAREDVVRLSRPLSDCLKLDWAHAFGRDDRGLLIWETPLFSNWPEAYQKIAEVKIAVRTALSFDPKRTSVVDRRHVLAYPVTNHRVKNWNASSKGGKLQNEGRLANQLRIKVSRRDGKFAGIFYHLPARLPDQLREALGQEEKGFVSKHELDVWRTVHENLDRRLHRCWVGK